MASPSTPSADAAPPGGPPVALTVAAVARQLGIAPATLRTWDRRYGLGPSGREAGSHRRYSAADVARLRTMRHLTLQGASPAEAARAALAEEDSQPAAAAVGGTAPLDGSGRGGGGRVVGLPGASPAARGLARAAMALDAPAAARIVDEHLERFGVVSTWDDLLAPVLVGVGARWASTGTGVDVEHVLSEVVMGSLRSVAARQSPPVAPRPVLLACAPEEQHSLPLHALASGLAERRVASRILGARVPTEALAAAVRRSGPSVVFVWSQLPETGDPAVLAAVPVTRPSLRLVVGGPGWGSPLPGYATAIGSLAEGVEEVTRAATA
jgi:DNA-binding transcriptional MerR regulator